MIRKFLSTIKEKIIKKYLNIKDPLVRIKGFSRISNDTKLCKGVIIYKNCRISKCYIGEYTYISENSVLSLVKIGKFCSVGPYLVCGLGIHPTYYVSTHPSFYSTLGQSSIIFSDKDYCKERKKIIIGNDVWIGARVTILDGVRIGDGAIIAAGSLVNKDVEDYTIVAGVPAKKIRDRFDEFTINELKKIKWWEWSIEKIYKQSEFFRDVKKFIELNNKEIL